MGGAAAEGKNTKTDTSTTRKRVSSPKKIPELTETTTESTRPPTEPVRQMTDHSTFNTGEPLAYFRTLKKHEPTRSRFWTEGGSGRWINREEDLDAVVVYVMEGQDRKGV